MIQADPIVGRAKLCSPSWPIEIVITEALFELKAPDNVQERRHLHLVSQKSRHARNPSLGHHSWCKSFFFVLVLEVVGVLVRFGDSKM